AEDRRDAEARREAIAVEVLLRREVLARGERRARLAPDDELGALVAKLCGHLPVAAETLARVLALPHQAPVAFHLADADLLGPRAARVRHRDTDRAVEHREEERDDASTDDPGIDCEREALLARGAGDRALLALRGEARSERLGDREVDRDEDEPDEDRPTD